MLGTTMRWIVVLGAFDNCEVRWVRKAANGDTALSLSLKSRFGLVDKGTNFICEGEGRISLLLKSKSWQNTAVLEDSDAALGCAAFRSVTSQYMTFFTTTSTQLLTSCTCSELTQSLISPGNLHFLIILARLCLLGAILNPKSRQFSSPRLIHP